MGGFQPLPGLGPLGLFPGQFGFTEAVFHGLQRYLHFVANIQGAFTVGIGKLVQGYHALRLQTGVNSHPLVINGKVKGGFTVDIESIRAFLPGSLIDVRPVRETTHLEGKELEFKVIKLDRKRNNVVVSRRAVMEAANSQEREELLQNLQEGMSVKGVVKNLTDYLSLIHI